MAEIVIEAEAREAGSSNAARRMRREEKLPAVVYGGDKESNPIILNPREIISVLKSESGQNTIFKLKVAGGSEDNVMIFDVQIDPITHHLIHADLMRIALDVEIEVSVRLRIVGEAKGVIEDGGVLDHSLRELVVSCLPTNIPESIDVDVSELDMNQSIKVEDLQVPPDVTVVTEPDRSVASVVAPVSEADLEADLGVEGEEIEGEEIEGEEPEEGAGEAPAEGAEAAKPEAAEEEKKSE
ncbi:MAG: 50S ribosomal protein L25 [Acidobacteria bacterium]|nr:50S ribosomal protein L25 [Acidobacteriota bacterium]